ncbi:unnamed protein product [Thelazia callipaeda]|uniref:Ig-like domain-containing protein n=1 Tax=Thelazia callipaeda TaxID=103827 RepID=A0A0N5D5P5_THECL|nr:unnamed protein product [Thelazia callipaeda]
MTKPNRPAIGSSNHYNSHSCFAVAVALHLSPCLLIAWCVFECQHEYLVSLVDYLVVDVGAEVRSSNSLRLEPAPLNSSRYLVRKGQKFRISCICQEKSINCQYLTWRNEFGRKIDGESSNSLFTVELKEHGSGYKKLSLVFTQIAERDTGFYKCVAENSQMITGEWEIELIVLDKVRWKESNDVVGGMLGESLTIDCGATGNPPPETHITNHDGLPLSETLFIFAGTEVTIKKLTKEYQDIAIKCLAVQEFAQYDVTVVEQHEIRLDIWSSPEFNTSLVERFVILDQLSAAICCNVTRSNPPAKYFRYLKNGEELRNSSKHVISISTSNQSACLTILSTTEYDLGEYRCEVSNGKSKARQTIVVREATPPSEVRVSLQNVGMTYAVWKIEKALDEQLPIQRYIIEYIKKSILDQGHDRNNEDNRIWFTHAIKMDVHLNEDGLYEIGGLHQGTTYIFRFTAENEAGTGETVTVTMKTTSKIRPSKLSSSGSSIFQIFTTIILCFHAFRFMLIP